jgi:metallo-beta-lactamase family protein
LRITFLGGAGTVTGSRFLVGTDRTKILVDCGLFQGLKVLRLRNWEPFPVEPSEIDAVVLTHAHLDHSGYLPVLVREGFDGPVHCTPPTQDLCEILLEDSAEIQESDAKRANRRGFSKHKPARPLYTRREARMVSDHYRSASFGEPVSIGDLTIRMTSAGHILGAASVHIRHADQSVVFSGDLGTQNQLLMPPPSPPEEADWIVMESTYGDRVRPKVDPIEALGVVASRTLEREGVLLIPSFAVGRAQAVLFTIHELVRRGHIPGVPVFLDSPMATDVTKLYERHGDFHGLTRDEFPALSSTAIFVRSVEASKELNGRPGPMIIIASSGMLTGGRILHHLVARADDPRNTVLLVGHQAEGSRGAALLRGAESVKIHGRWVPVRAEVTQLDVFSAHADQEELIGWLGSCGRPPQQVVLVHGEATASDELRLRIEERLGYPTRVAEHGEAVEVA